MSSPRAIERLSARLSELAELPPKRPVEIPEDVDLLVAAEKIAKRHGLTTDRLDLPVAALFPSIDAQHPVITLDANGAPLLVIDRKGSRVLVEDDDGTRAWWNKRQLTSFLGLTNDGEIQPWVSLDLRPAAPVSVGPETTPWQAAMLLLGSERTNLISIVIYAVGVGVLSLTLPLAVQMLVNTVAFGQLLQPILVLTLLLASGLIFGAVLRAMQAWMVEVVQRRVFVGLVSQIGQRLPRVHASAFDRGHGPELINRFFDVFTAQKAVASLLLGGIEALLTALVGLIVLAFYHPVLLGFGALLIASVVVVFILLGRGATDSTVKESKAKYAVAGWLEEMARHVFALKMAGGAAYALDRLDGLASDWLRYRADHFRVYFRQFVGALGLQVIAHASLLGLGGWLVVQRELSVGQLVAAELIVTAVVASLSKLGGKLETVYDLVAAADKLSALLTIPVEDDDGESAMVGDLDVGARVELTGLTCHGDIIRDLDMTVAPGERIAVTGHRPARQVLVDLLFGMHDPATGYVAIDGHDIRDLKLGSLRHRVAVVREPEPLPDTIAANVRASGGNLPATEIWEILETVGLAKHVRTLPDGLRTTLQPSGAPFDREDALRLTIARAIAAKPGLLVLDGVLDAVSPATRVDLARRLCHRRTLIVTTGDAALVDSCDRVISLPDHQSEEVQVA